MTKPTPQSDPQPKATTRDKTASAQDLQVAYQCHTLAQLVFGQLAAAYPWLATPQSFGAAGWPQPTMGQPPTGQPQR